MLTGIPILACWVFLGLYWNISARSIKPTAEGQDWSGRLARMPIWLGYILLIVIWAYPFGMVVMGRTAVSGSLAVAICALGLLVCKSGVPGPTRARTGVEHGNREATARHNLARLARARESSRRAAAAWPRARDPSW